ncbi:MAG: hypothetical protein NXI31_07655 [bacterium]|nr:hypothetical protein [bacterium]
MRSRSLAILLPLLTLWFPGCSNRSADEPVVSISFNPAIYLGNWAGTWTNTTNNGTGNLTINVTQDMMTMTVEFEITGEVFGVTDPEPETFELDIGAGEAELVSVTSDVFGTLTGIITGSAVISAVGTGVPGTASSFELIGTVDGDKMTVNGVIRLENGGITTGNATLNKM